MGATKGATGAEHWSELDPDYATCNTGKEQSPIDIRNAEKAELPALRFESKSGPLKYLINNGYTIRVNYHDAPGTGNLLIVGDKRYQLTQFHFHRPSEEYIHGKPYDMVAHLMHQASDGQGCRSRSSSEGGQRERDHSADLGTYAKDREQSVD